MSNFQLKNIYSPAFIEALASIVDQVTENFDKELFITNTFDSTWESLELKQRMRHISIQLHKVLDNDYKIAVQQLVKIADIALSLGFKANNLEFIFLPDYIEQYGLEDYTTSVWAIEKITQFVSCEFAVRPFYIRYEEAMLKQTLVWAKHPHHHVRRLASEGCRPRLPWAIALPEFKKDPHKIIPILEALKGDESEWVRRSVANNLNDIAKDHPTEVVKLAQKWKGQSKEQDWIVKHGSRTLLKKGNKDILALFGLSYHDALQIKDFQISTPVVRIGDYLEFSFMLENNSEKKENIRIEYALYYLKANGTHNPKVFKISEKVYPAQSSQKINRRQSFKIISTRKFHTGKHALAIIINGKEFDQIDFELKA